MAKERRWLAWLLPSGVLGTAVLAFVLLERTPGYAPGLGFAVLLMGGLGGFGLLSGILILQPGKQGPHGSQGPRGRQALLLGSAVIAAACVLAGPAAHSLSTVGRDLDGTFATAGPEAATRFAFDFSPDRQELAASGEHANSEAKKLRPHIHRSLPSTLTDGWLSSCWPTRGKPSFWWQPRELSWLLR